MFNNNEYLGDTCLIIKTGQHSHGPDLAVETAERGTELKPTWAREAAERGAGVYMARTLPLRLQSEELN